MYRAVVNGTASSTFVNVIATMTMTTIASARGGHSVRPLRALCVPTHGTTLWSHEKLSSRSDAELRPGVPVPMNACWAFVLNASLKVGISDRRQAKIGQRGRERLRTASPGRRWGVPGLGRWPSVVQGRRRDWEEMRQSCRSCRLNGSKLP